MKKHSNSGMTSEQTSKQTKSRGPAQRDTKEVMAVLVGKLAGKLDAQAVSASVVAERRRNVVPAVALHEQRLERVPELVAGDAGFYSAHGESQALAMGVKRISIPNHSSKSLARRRHQNNAGSVKGRNGEPVSKARSVC